MIERTYPLRLGLPHTNYGGAAEHLMMAWLGACEWDAIAVGIGTPLSELRTKDGSEVYGTFFYIESNFASGALWKDWNLDEEVVAVVRVASYKNLLVDSTVTLTGPSAKQANFRMCNIFITPKASNETLKVSPPAHVDFTQLATLSHHESPYRISRDFEERGCLGLVEANASSTGECRHSIQLDPERDTNGAGLVYFANYYVYLNMAMRAALQLRGPAELPNPERRRLIYLGNVDPTDAVEVVTKFVEGDRTRQEVRRRSDGKRICYAETQYVQGALGR